MTSRLLDRELHSIGRGKTSAFQNIASKLPKIRKNPGLSSDEAGSMSRMSERSFWEIRTLPANIIITLHSEAADEEMLSKLVNDE